MAKRYGMITMEDNTRVYDGTIGQEAIFSQIQAEMGEHNKDMVLLNELFVEGITDRVKQRYHLPALGKLPRMGRQSLPPTIKRTGYWEVGFPLVQYGAQVTGSDVDMAYMTGKDLKATVTEILEHDIGMMRYNIMQSILDRTNPTFTDPEFGNVTVRRLANNDGATYPPVAGSETELTTHDHYDYTGYTVANITDATAANPLILARNDLVEHFGGLSTGGDPILFLTTAAVGDMLATTMGTAGTWYPVPDYAVDYGDDTGLAKPRLPRIPGYLMGRSYGCHVGVWEWIPANYAIAIHLAAPAPLMKRKDLDATGLPGDLHIVETNPVHPLEGTIWRHRCGFGAGSRLSAVVIQFTEDSEYTIPTDYTDEYW